MEPEIKGDKQGLARQRIAVARARGLAKEEGGTVQSRVRRETEEGPFEGALLLLVLAMVEMEVTAEAAITTTSTRIRKTVTTRRARGERSVVPVGLENESC